ncbi:hypothetical protein VNO80_13384 [Phaseolus coccineus]|uniref:Uncharacterized protein n=1 Tax=Phaseolus coccineus TaxID=3886 RepID=A0AAN9N6K8_PHACN
MPACLSRPGDVRIPRALAMSAYLAPWRLLKLRDRLEPFQYVADETSPWEEKSVVARLANKGNKSKRNKLWRKKKRKHVAEMIAKEHEQFEQINREADDWIAREKAKEIANIKGFQKDV